MKPDSAATSVESQTPSEDNEPPWVAAREAWNAEAEEGVRRLERMRDE